MLGAGNEDTVVAMDETGHATRTQVAMISVQGSRILNIPGRGRLVAALASAGDGEILLACADGSGKRLPASAIPPAEQLNTRGKAFAARRTIRGLAELAPNSHMWAITTHRLIPLEPTKAPLDDPPSLKVQRLVTLAAGEEITALATETGR